MLGANNSPWVSRNFGQFTYTCNFQSDSLTYVFFQFQKDYTVQNNCAEDFPTSSTRSSNYKVEGPNIDSELVQEFETKLPYPIQRESSSTEKPVLGSNTFLQQTVIKCGNVDNVGALSGVEPKRDPPLKQGVAPISAILREAPAASHHMSSSSQQFKSIQSPDLETDAAPTESTQETGKPGLASGNQGGSYSSLGVVRYATASPSILKGYHKSLIDGSPSILVWLTWYK